MALILRIPIHLYRWLISPFLHALCGGSSCRFHPSCSTYALEALKSHGALGGMILALRRIMRCHPWGGGGLDPVPEPKHPSVKPQESRTASSPVCSTILLS